MGLMLICSALLRLFSALGLAYIVWILAAKQEGGMKTTGMVISVVIVILALISVLYGARSFGRTHHMNGSDKTGISATDKSGVTKEEGTHKASHSLKHHKAM
jgi:hypothetical protein